MHSPGMLTIYTNHQTKRGGRMVPYNSLWANSPGRGRKRKESLQLCLWNLIICIEKVDAKCWLVKMTVTISFPLACVFQCLFTFALISASPWLVEMWQLSWWGATGELEMEFKFQRCICKLSFFSLPYPALESLPTGYPNKRETDWEEYKHYIFWNFPNGMSRSTWFSNWNVWLCHINGKYPWQLETLVTTIGFGP